MDQVNSWKWVLEKCEHEEIDPFEFMNVLKVKNVGFVGDSFNENFVVSLMRVLRVADLGSKKWKRKGAWRRGYFPKFNATVWYHRVVLLAKYDTHQQRLNKIFRMVEIQELHTTRVSGKITVVILVRDRCPRRKGDVEELWDELAKLGLGLRRFLVSMVPRLNLVPKEVMWSLGSQVESLRQKFLAPTVSSLMAYFMAILTPDSAWSFVVIDAIVGVVIVVASIGVVVVIVNGGVSHIIKLFNVSFNALGKSPDESFHNFLGVWVQRKEFKTLRDRHGNNGMSDPIRGLDTKSGVVDLTGDEDPSDEDGGTRMGDSIGVLVSLGEKTSMFKRYLVISFEESGEMFPDEAEKVRMNLKGKKTWWLRLGAGLQGDVEEIWDELAKIELGLRYCLVSMVPRLNLVPKQVMWPLGSQVKSLRDNKYVAFPALSVATATSAKESIPRLRVPSSSTDNLGAARYMLPRQETLLPELLDKAHMANCNQTRTPVDTKSKLGSDGDPISDPTLYRSLAGLLVAYTDADWAGCPTTRRSTSAEYRGVANVVAETAWLRNLLRELHTPLLSLTLIYCDNVYVIYMTANPVQHQRTKHIEIDIHFVRDMVARDFEEYTLYEPDTYRRDLLENLDTLEAVIHRAGILRMKENEVNALKVNGKQLNEEILREHETKKSFKLQLQDVQINPHKSLVIESTTLEANLNMDVNALDAGSVITESSETKSDTHDTSNSSGNYITHAVDADIKPVNDQVPFAENKDSPEFCEFLEINGLKAQLQARNSMINNLKKQIKNVHEKSNEAKVKRDIDVIEIINIELEHNVAKLLKENKTLKKHYKDLYDSIKVTRTKTIEQTTSLIARNDEFKAQLQEKGFTIATLKNKLRKLKGNSVDTKFAKPSILGKPVLQPLRNQLIVRQQNAFKSERPNFSKLQFVYQVDVNNILSKPVTPHYLPKDREHVFVKPHHVIASGSSRNSSKEIYGSNDMAHNYYLEEAKKKTHDKNMNLKPRVMHTTSLQNTTNGSKPKPRSNNLTSRSLPTFGLYTSSLLNAACKKSMNLLQKGLLVWGKLRQLPKGEYRDGPQIADMD
uniref:Ribonuclease H-like domain-containing protein n=1 Tax=Tanacetum cinerariifolium TaxID=118510 RepID=A0A6L2NIP6_TANCI|nr:ribonuclease H-like domain-containing protein [Tanacetum cinerariifolium]